jgi:hypothetical protein
MLQNNNRSLLKKVFWPNFGVMPSLQILNIPVYACGLKLRPALILNQNPFLRLFIGATRQIAQLRT